MDREPAQVGVVVIGGGVVGLYAGAVLAERGHAVRILEGRSPHERTGASFVNAGLLTPSHLVPLSGPGVPRQVLTALGRRSPPLRVALPRDRATVRWLLLALASCTQSSVDSGTPVLGRLLVESLTLLKDDLRRCGREDLIQGEGMVMVAHTAGGFAHARELAEAAAANEIESRVLDAAALRATEPSLGADVIGGAWFPGDARVDPGELMALLASRAQAAGARIDWGRSARALRVERGRVRGVDCEDGFEAADAVVLAAGVASAGLLRGVGIDLPLIGGRGYGLTLEVPADRLPRHASILVEDYMAVSPRRAGLHLTSGMVLGARHERVDSGRVRAMRAAAERAFPLLRPTGDVSSAASGMRPCTPDGLPYIGAVDRVDGLIVATGHGMLGLSLAAATANRVAATLEGYALADRAPLRAERFPRSGVRAVPRALLGR